MSRYLALAPNHMLTTKARHQIEQILQYAAAGGNAALVNLRTATIIATDGDPDSTGLIAQLSGLVVTRGSVEGLDGVMVSHVSGSYRLVVKVTDVRFDCGPLKLRMDKACELLGRMVDGSSLPSAGRFMPWMTKK